MNSGRLTREEYAKAAGITLAQTYEQDQIVDDALGRNDVGSWRQMKPRPGESFESWNRRATDRWLRDLARERRKRRKSAFGFALMFGAGLTLWLAGLFGVWAVFHYTITYDALAVIAYLILSLMAAMFLEAS